jgi:hypothetical protein
MCVQGVHDVITSLGRSQEMIYMRLLIAREQDRKVWADKVRALFLPAPDRESNPVYVRTSTPVAVKSKTITLYT